MDRPTIRIGGYAPPDSVHSRALDRFAAHVGEVTDGEVCVEVLYNIMDTGRPIDQLLDLVRSGELTWCYLTTSYLGAVVPALDALEIPFLFDDLAAAHAALDGPFGGELGAAVTEAIGLEVLGFWDNGFRHLTNRLRPLRSPADCEGLTIRLQPNAIHEALAEAWGMTPRPAELSEGIDLIARGAVDAQENPLANTFAYGVDHRHVTLSGHLYGARGVFADPQRLASLDADTRALVRGGVRVAIDYQRPAAESHEADLLRRFVAEGRQVIPLSAEERRAFVDAAAEVVAEARSAVADDLLELLV